MTASQQLREIQGVALFKFHEGKVEEFKRLCAELMDIVRAKDSGTAPRPRTLGCRRSLQRTAFAGRPILSKHDHVLRGHGRY